jgi:hypothetical protein
VSSRFSRSSAVRALTRFWADDAGLSFFSALLLVFIFVVPPLLAPGSGRRVAGDVAYALLLISGVHALAARGLARMVLMPVAVITLAVYLGSRVVPVPEPWVQGMGLLSLLLFLAVVLGQTLRAGPVTFHRIQGAVASYLLLGLIWAHAYALLAQLRPGAFSGPVSATDGSRAFLYFSFVTLATVGYGDVLPVHPVARSLAMLEAVTGTLYLATVIARLVSLAVAPGAKASGDG